MRFFEGRRYPYEPACALAQLGMARAYALSGNKAASRDAYQQFLALWRDADRDMPLLRQAQTEYDALSH